MATKTINIRAAQPSLRELLSLVEDGGEVILMEDGKPVARLIAVVDAAPAGRVFDLHPGAIRTSEDFDAPLPEDFWLGEE